MPEVSMTTINDWADRGRMLQIDLDDPATPRPHCVGLSRMGGARVTAAACSAWVVLRGHAWVECKEGRFRLRRGEWMVFERDSVPVLHTDETGLAVGVLLRAPDLKLLEQIADNVLYPGRGRLPAGELRVALQLWRAARAGSGSEALRPVLLHIARAQRELATRVQLCPGRSRSRKRQVFGRMQRARLYLEGHNDRVVRIGELADLTNFSSWYFSKAFQSLYEESPQALSARLRLERAAELLTSTSMTVGEVAASCGFDNCCSFARAFRARHGTTATAYRARHERYASERAAA
ncbi:helix-turn-helix domain-containing protein [Luteimonas yindakuii]|uniref:Helix-turn-helix domain-containing protein n=1 Tax=Luteimonas yindakuii TaxID=2565782 RepID=A0A4Z1R1Z7_9GAMM|nr:helix-turn-helix domain-containing protein [Luteimonas yindakuii]